MILIFFFGSFIIWLFVLILIRVKNNRSNSFRELVKKTEKSLKINLGSLLQI